LRAAELLNAREHVLECSLSKLDASANLEAVKFNKKLAEVVKGDPTYMEAKVKLIAGIQELFEEFVVQGVRAPGAKKQGRLFRELCDEWYLQMYRLAEVHRAASAQRQNSSTKELLNCLLVLALVSNYCIPANKSLHEGLLHWLLTLRTKMQSQDFRRVLTRALNNFSVNSDIEEAHSQSDQESVITEENEAVSLN